jgi:hypothetical protein
LTPNNGDSSISRQIFIQVSDLTVFYIAQGEQMMPG